MREFTTALEEDLEELEYSLSFVLDDETYRFRRPVGGEAIALSAAMATRRSKTEKFAATIDIVLQVMDEDSRQRFSERLLDVDDPFSRQAPLILAGDGEEDGLVHEMIREWSGRPTRSSSSSSSRQPKAGGGSTRSTRTSTSSRSRSRSS